MTVLPPGLWHGGTLGEEAEQQRAIDAEVDASYQGWAGDDRARAAAGRAADRIAAEQAREAAHADREQDSRNRAAAIADRDHPAHPEPTDP